MDSAIITRYATQDATVTWRPHTCNHSGICLRGLPDVFDPPRCGQSSNKPSCDGSHAAAGFTG